MASYAIMQATRNYAMNEHNRRGAAVGESHMTERERVMERAKELRERLLDVCREYDDEDAVYVAALFEAWVVVLTCGAPTPEAAKAVLKQTLEHVEPGVDAAWAKYRARDTN